MLSFGCLLLTYLSMRAMDKWPKSVQHWVAPCCSARLHCPDNTVKYSMTNALTGRRSCNLKSSQQSNCSLVAAVPVGTTSLGAKRCSPRHAAVHCA